jgi:hypothetical protein
MVATDRSHARALLTDRIEVFSNIHVEPTTLERRVAILGRPSRRDGTEHDSSFLRTASCSASSKIVKRLAPEIADLFEREANNFARFVLFQGDGYRDMAADHKFEIKTPMKLAGKFGAPRVCPDPSPALRGLRI